MQPVMLKQKKSRSKRITRWLHLWLGLASGLIVFIVSITGCLYVFNKEISYFTDHKLLFIQEPAETNTHPLSELKNLAEKELGTAVYSVTSYKEKNRSWEFMTFQSGDNDALWFFDTVKHYKSAFINPYTGELTGIKDYKKDFFVIVKYLHWSLLLNTKYGQPLVGYSTLIFVILLITGLILWWPKNLNSGNVNKSFKINWKGNFKRLNYDLHNVPGFYALLISLLLALTGMTWAFDWFRKTVYIIASTSVTAPPSFNVSSDSTRASAKNPLDLAFLSVQNTIPAAERISLYPPTHSSGTILVTAYYDKENYYDADLFKFDQYSGKFLLRENFKDKNNGEKILEMNYDIHVGAIMGLTGKIIAFLSSFVAASLPVTGLIIWLGRKKRASRATRGVGLYSKRRSRKQHPPR